MDYAAQLDGLVAVGNGENPAGYTSYQEVVRRMVPLSEAYGQALEELIANNCNLDRKNPSAKEDVTHLPPEELAASILDKERRIAEIIGKIQTLLPKSGA